MRTRIVALVTDFAVACSAIVFRGALCSGCHLQAKATGYVFTR